MGVVREKVLAPTFADSSKPGATIAIVGAGVAGVVAAYLLDRKYRVTLFENDTRLGGHTNTVTLVDGPDAGTRIDTGFIVLNDQTYPLLHRFLEQLSVPVESSDMSFGVYCDATGLHYAGTSGSGLFAQKRNLLRPSFYRMIGDILRFGRETLRELEAGTLAPLLLGDYVTAKGYSQRFVEDYLIPMGGAIWSATPSQVLAYPAESFVRFFKNHGLLSLRNRPRWQTLPGRGKAYLEAFQQRFRGNILLNAGVEGISRQENSVTVHRAGGVEERFDQVVLACHANQSFQLLRDPSQEESRNLGSWAYQKNLAFLHTDASIMPPVRRAWASWNVRTSASEKEAHPVCVTYHMNRLQNLKTESDYFVTLNPTRSLDPNKTLREFVYYHPTFTFDSLATQSQLRRLNGTRNTFFCGSYLGYGFHEDAVRSAVEVAHLLGVDL